MFGAIDNVRILVIGDRRIGAALSSTLQTTHDVECVDQIVAGWERAVRAQQEARPFGWVIVHLPAVPNPPDVTLMHRLCQTSSTTKFVVCIPPADDVWAELIRQLDIGTRMRVLEQPLDLAELAPLMALSSCSRRPVGVDCDDSHQHRATDETSPGCAMSSAQQPGSTGADQISQVESREAPRGRGEMILVADDEFAVRRVAVRILNRAGYRTLEAADGYEALQKFAAYAGQIQLVLLDLVMPHLNGHDAHNQLRGLRADLAIIFCTGYDPQKELGIDTKHTDDSLIEKPFYAETLLWRVRRTLDCEPLCPSN